MERTTSEERAQRRMGQLSTALMARVLSLKSPTVFEAIKAWEAWRNGSGGNPMTTENQRITLCQWVREMGIKTEMISDIGPEFISGFINMPGSSKKASTRETDLAIIRSFFRFCSAKDWVRGNPPALVRVKMDMMTHVQKERRPRAEFSDKEIKALLDATEEGGPHASAFWHCAIAIGRYTGLRLGDICQLQWDCFRTKGKMAIWTDKRDKRVELPMTPQALADAVASIPIKDTTWCFPEEARIIKEYSKRSKLSNAFKNLMRRCGIENRTFHDLRSTYASVCYRKGIPMPHISKSLGHSSVSQTDHYVVKGR